MGRHESSGPPEQEPEADTYFEYVVQHYIRSRQEIGCSIVHVSSQHDYITGNGVGAIIFSAPERFSGDTPAFFMDYITATGHFEDDFHVYDGLSVAWLAQLPENLLAVGIPPDAGLPFPTFMVFHQIGKK